MLRSRSRGFTLVEMVFTMAIVAILVLGVMAGTNASMKSRTLSRERDVAREAIRARLEAIADAPYDTLLAMDGTQFPVPNPADLPSGVPVREPLTSSVTGEQPGKVSVSDSPAPAGDYNGDTVPDLLFVSVEVRWVGADGRPNRMEGSTYLAERD